MISKPRRSGDYPDREVDCQEAMESGFQAINDCMIEASWTRDEAKRALRRLIAADNMTQKENAKMEAELAIARAMIRAGKAGNDNVCLAVVLLSAGSTLPPKFRSHF
ncbi:hypothetical protein [Mesorhizobium sp.]|uniref:hypothetical protein n=1 Tax=Mesorhizobium sp. TaxID=1871066 RepID=UPI0025B8D9DB|nr:hypothetical protein [Mesorhizobium sp.]